MSIMQKSAILGSLIALAHAHGRVISIDVDGTEYEGYTSGMVGSASTGIAWSADNQDNGFVSPSDYSSSDIACHKSGAPGSEAAPIAAGGKLTLQWDTWPESHHGPVIDYLAKCAGDDCSSVSAGDLSFFKIDEAGLNDGASQSWASDDLIAAGNSWEVTIPSDLAPGQYVLRHEIIALHSAQDENGAQNYPQCINIEVTGSGSNEPSGVAATELYSASDAGITTSIYEGLTSYEIPGPAVISGGGSSSGGSSSSGSSSEESSEESSESSPSASASSSAPSATASSSTSTGNDNESSNQGQDSSNQGQDNSNQGQDNNNQGQDDNGSSAPEPTGAPTFAGSSPAASKTASCTTTITLTADSTPSATNAPLDTSSNDDDESEETKTPTTTTAPKADVSAIASALPSSVLNEPAEADSSDSNKPSKDLPEGFTLNDLLEWVNYLIGKAFNDGNHARDVTRN